MTEDARAPAEHVRIATERWFLRRGLPHFIDGYDARTDIWTRAVPVLVFIFVVETLNAVNLDDGWPLWVNVVAPLGAFALLVAMWAVTNRWRGRPALARPRDVGVWEIAIFVLGPPVVPIVFGGQVGSAALTLVVNLALLPLVYFVTSYGVVPMVRWGAERVGKQILDVAGVVLRALPLLLLVVTFLFVNAEAWQVAASLPWPAVLAVASLFFAVGAGFSVLRVPREIGELAVAIPSLAALESATEGTPVAAACRDLPDPPPAPASLSRRQWGNVGLVVLVSQAVQVALVVLGVFAFFTLFGFLAVSPEVVASWVGVAPRELATLSVGGHEMVLSRELVKVATFLAAFSGLSFTVSLLTDATYRAEFLDDVLGDVRRALAVRVVYLAAPAAGAGAAGGTTGGTGTGPARRSGTISPT